MAGANCGLHPLIHTCPLPDLTQDIVAVSKWQKCGLKYVMFTLGINSERWGSVVEEAPFSCAQSSANISIKIEKEMPAATSNFLSTGS